MSGKGSDARPLSVNQQTFADNWSRTFGSAAEKPPTPPAPDLRLDFTGVGVLVLELADYGPMDLRFSDHELMLKLLQVILDHSDEPFEVLASDAAQQEASRQLLEPALRSEG